MTIIMKRIAAVAYALLALCVSSICLAGCSSADGAEAESSVAVIVQNTANSPQHDSGFAQSVVQRSIETSGYVDIIIADGSPTSTVGAGTIVGSNSESPENRARQNESQLYSILAAINSSHAVSPEVDMLAAFEYAARSLASAPAKSGDVVVAASGFSTSGILNFTVDGMISADPDEVASYLSEKGLLPDLSAIRTVTWYGLGDVEAPQVSPSQLIKNNIQAIYVAVLRKAGVGDVVFDASLASSAYAEPIELPMVTPVDLPVADISGLGRQVNASENTGQPVRLDGVVLRFEPDSAVFSDPTAANEALAPFVNTMKENSEIEATLFGSCASYPWDEAYPKRLSEKRAEAVKAVMVEQGVDPNRIMTVGLGDGAPDHVNDIDPETGLQVPSQAALNRYVEIQLTK